MILTVQSLGLCSRSGRPSTPTGHTHDRLHKRAVGWRAARAALFIGDQRKYWSTRMKPPTRMPVAQDILPATGMHRGCMPSARGYISAREKNPPSTMSRCFGE